MGHLTQEQRYTIQVLRQEKQSLTEIAFKIGRHKSVISRELRRNCDQRNGVYKADLAIRKCQERHLSKRKHLSFTAQLQSDVNYWIKEDYSPEQIVGIAKNGGNYCVSTERIYQYIWADKKQGGKLYEHLRSKGKRYRKRGASKDKRGQIANRVDIEMRPLIVEEKTRFGDLEMDLVIGKDHKGALLTINDRATGMLKMCKLVSKDAIEVEKAATNLLQAWKPLLFTITTDNGKEFSGHQSIASELLVDYYFAKPYQSWQRGANENLNGLIRQYFPKGSAFESITEQDVKNVECKLNSRPRKRFGFKSPNEVFLQTINNNGQVAFMT